jgi:hypothetical protein
MTLGVMASVECRKLKKRESRILDQRESARVEQSSRDLRATCRLKLMLRKISLRERGRFLGMWWLRGGEERMNSTPENLWLEEPFAYLLNSFRGRDELRLLLDFLEGEV